MNSNINYSFIIPHKNIPALLQRCIDSIPRRDDVQIIVVDDNSDPAKVDFNNFPGINDPCIKLFFTKEGRGAGFARNIGLTKASGKWLLFADSDDYFTDGFLDYIDKYKDSNYDLIYFGVYKVDKAGNKKINIDYNYDKLMRNATLHQKYDEYKYAVFVPWGKLISHSLIKENKINFDETIAANDKLFSVKTAHYAKNIHFDPYRIYIYELGANIYSLTSKKNKAMMLRFDRFNAHIRLNNFFDSILQKKYKINMTSLLLKLINFHDMTYFYRGIYIMKENNINIFMEFIKFCILYPYQNIVKFTYKIRYKKKYI